MESKAGKRPDGAVLLLGSVLATALILPARAAVVVSTAPTAGIACSGGTCTPTSTDAVLNTTDLESMLAAGNVSVSTVGNGVEAGGIQISAGLTWASPATLSLTATQAVTIAAPVKVAGIGGLTIAMGLKDFVIFAGSGRVVFAHKRSNLVIAGNAYKLLRTIADLLAAVEGDSGGKGHFALMDDYDASADGTYTTSPIGVFISSLDGLGNTISNVTINDKAYGKYLKIGFFGSAGRINGSNSAYGFSIKNIRLANETILVPNADKPYVGGLVGDAYDGTFRNDRVTGTIVAPHSYAGGFAGLISSPGLLTASSADVSVRATYAGGLVVACNSCTITASSASGPVVAVGGAKNAGSYGSGHAAGGLLGYNDGLIDQCFATGTVSGGRQSSLGGLIGDNMNTVTNSYARGNLRVRAGAYAGGLFGGTDPGYQTSTSYTTTRIAKGATTNYGGFAYNPKGAPSDNYWDTTTSGTQYAGGNQTSPAGYTGLTTAQLQSGLPAGFDPAIWAQNPAINDGFPYLINNPPHP